MELDLKLDQSLLHQAMSSQHRLTLERLGRLRRSSFRGPFIRIGFVFDVINKLQSFGLVRANSLLKSSELGLS